MKKVALCITVAVIMSIFFSACQQNSKGEKVKGIQDYNIDWIDNIPPRGDIYSTLPNVQYRTFLWEYEEDGQPVSKTYYRLRDFAKCLTLVNSKIRFSVEEKGGAVILTSPADYRETRDDTFPVRWEWGHDPLEEYSGEASTTITTCPVVLNGEEFEVEACFLPDGVYIERVDFDNEILGRLGGFYFWMQKGSTIGGLWTDGTLLPVPEQARVVDCPPGQTVILRGTLTQEQPEQYYQLNYQPEYGYSYSYTMWSETAEPFLADLRGVFYERTPVYRDDQICRTMYEVSRNDNGGEGYNFLIKERQSCVGPSYLKITVNSMGELDSKDVDFVLKVTAEVDSVTAETDSPK